MIRFFVMDVDGTLTDGKIYMGQSGEMMKAFDVKDGYAIAHILPDNDIIPVVITARKSNIVEYRCCDLGIKQCHQGRADKLCCLKEIIAEYSLQDKKEYSLANVAYIGDDLMDLECMRAVRKEGGAVGCPNDAAKEVAQCAIYVCKKNGGDGAVREFIEWIVKGER